MAKTKKRRKSSSVHKRVMSAHRSGRRRKSARRRRTGLSEAFTPEGAKTGFKKMLSGGIGGAAVYGLDGLGVRKLPALASLGIYLGASFLTSAMAGADATAGGIAGAGVYSVMQRSIGGMSEMENHAYAKQGVLNEYPDAMDEDGNPMYLAEDGNFYYLSEEGDYQLAASMQADLYPSYVNTSGF